MTLTPVTMPLNNSGDDIYLIDAQATIRDQVRHEGTQVQVGVPIVIAQ